MVVTVKEIEPYCKEVIRKHVQEKGFQLFKHPTMASAYIVCENGIVVGMTNNRILKDNSISYWLLKDRDFLPFTF